MPKHGSINLYVHGNQKAQNMGYDVAVIYPQLKSSREATVLLNSQVVVRLKKSGGHTYPSSKLVKSGKGHEDENIKVWKRTRGRKHQSLEKDTKMKISKSGKGHEDENIKVWKRTRRRKHQSLEKDTRTKTSKSGKGHEDENIKVWKRTRR